jgi:hypothetical protein
MSHGVERRVADEAALLAFNQAGLLDSIAGTSALRPSCDV